MPSIIFKGPARYCKDRHEAKRGRRRFTPYRKRDEILLSIGFESYADYLTSPLWKLIRDAKIAVDPTCELCGLPAQEVHHISYRKNVLIGKHQWSLLSVCCGCHKRIEFTESGKKRTFYEVHSTVKRLLKASGRWFAHTRKGAKKAGKQ